MSPIVNLKEPTSKLRPRRLALLALGSNSGQKKAIAVIWQIKRQITVRGTVRTLPPGRASVTSPLRQISRNEVCRTR